MLNSPGESLMSKVGFFGIKTQKSRLSCRSLLGELSVSTPVKQ